MRVTDVLRTMDIFESLPAEELEGIPLAQKWPNNPVVKSISEIVRDVDRRAKEMLALAGRG